MSRPKKGDSQKRMAISISLSPEMVGILSHHPNRSEIVSHLLEENAHRLGDTTLLEAEELRRMRVREVINEELAHALENIRHKLIDVGIGRLDWVKEENK